jgi:hypothetical protein
MDKLQELNVPVIRLQVEPENNVFNVTAADGNGYRFVVPEEFWGDENRLETLLRHIFRPTPETAKPPT